MVWAIVSVTSGAAGLIQTVTGFGAVVLMMLILPFFFSIVDAATLSLTIALLFCIVFCWQYREHIRMKVVLPPTILYTVVHLAALQLVDRVDAGWLGLVFAVFLILLSLYYLLAAKRVRVAPKPLVGLLCGGFSGMISAFFAIGGPPMAVYFLAAAESHFSYVGCMQFMFAVTTVAGLLGRVVNGLYQVSLLPYAALGTLGMMIGMKLGRMVSDRLDAERMRFLTYLLVGVSGVVFLLQNL